MLKYLLLVLTVFFPLLGWSHSNLNKIPLEDRKKLENFFDYLMHNSIIGYSLCGEKPVSMESFPVISKIPPKYAIKIFAKHPGYSILWHGLGVWQRYSQWFPSNNFVFRFIPAYSTIVLINKRATLKVIEDNLNLFQKYSNSKQTALEFLEEVCFPKDKEYMIRYNTVLLGILLGYGKNNSLAFAKRSYVQKLEGFKLYNTNDSLNAFMNPGFFIINNGTNEEENEKIRYTLRLAKQKIEENFNTGPYLEKFITLFTR